MKHPPYHLRPNKAADRYVFFELLKLYEKDVGFEKHQYLGFGGPFMVEFREFARVFPSMRLNCIEENLSTHLRQKFHSPKKGIRFTHSSFANYVAESLPEAIPLVAWLDFNDLHNQTLVSLGAFVQRVTTPSIVRVTVPVLEPRKKGADATRDAMKHRLGKLFIPEGVEWAAVQQPEGSVKFMLDVLRHAAQRVLDPGGIFKFTVLQMSTYRDSRPMVSLTGFVGDEPQTVEALLAAKNCQYSDPDSNEPLCLDCPNLSMKERMHLEGVLPTLNGSVKPLAKRLGYLIDIDDEKSLEQLKYYHKFHHAYPTYGKFSV